MLLFLHGERVDELVARVERRIDGPTAAERVLEVVDEALEEDGEENRLELRAPQVYQQKRGQEHMPVQQAGLVSSDLDVN